MEKSKKIAALIFVGVPIVCCLGGILLVFSASGNAKKSDATELAAARKLGMPLEPADLETTRIPEDKNAAEIYRQAGDMLEHGYSKAQRAVTAALVRDPKPKAVAEGAQAVAHLKPVFDLVSGLDTKTGCDFARDWAKGPSLLFPEFAGMKALVKDLCLWADKQDLDGDTRASLKSMRYAERVALDAGSDSCLISMLVEVSCRGIIDRIFERLIDRHSGDMAYLAQVRDIVAAHTRLPDPRKYLGGEVVLNRIAIRSLSGTRDLAMYNGDTQTPRRNDGVQKSFFRSTLVQTSLDSKLLGVWRVGWTRFPKDSQDWEGYLAAMKAMDAKVESDNSLGNTVNKILFPMFDQGLDAVGNIQAHDRMLLTSINLLQARDKTGALPVVLPSSLGDTRLDPFDGNPLRYRPDGKGFLLYSIGRDRVDNGGHVRKAGDMDTTGYDEVMQFQ